MPTSSSVDRLAELLATGTYVDLSPTIDNGIPRWITHPPLTLYPTVNHEHDGYYCQVVNLAEHTGSHIDAPAHTNPTMMDKSIDTIAPQTFLAPAVRIDLRPFGLGPGDLATSDTLAEAAAHLEQEIRPGDVILLDFGWLARYWTTSGAWKSYSANTPGLDESAVEWIAAQRPRAVGADTVAVEIALKDGVEVNRDLGHTRHWLPKGIYIIEQLANLELLPERFIFMALPLKIARGSGSPVRAIAVTYPQEALSPGSAL